MNDKTLNEVLKGGKKKIKQSMLDSFKEFAKEITDEYADIIWETVNTIVQLTAENADLRERLDKAVELKAKVGDTVYMPWVYDGVSDIAKSHICSIIMDSETVTYAVDVIADLGDAENGFVEKYKHGQFTKKDFGKIVFTDYTEAEARLKEIVEDGE